MTVVTDKISGIAIFDSDGTLILENSNRFFARARGRQRLSDELESLRYDDKITSGEYNRLIAPIFAGMTEAEVLDLCGKIPTIEGI